MPEVEAPDRTLRCRFELKYLLPEPVAQALEARLAPSLTLDRFSAGQPRGEYPIASLYLDSPDLRLYRESMEGRATRFKLRVRAYDDAPASPCFLEVKRRINAVVTKTRARIERDELREALTPAGPPSGRAPAPADDRRRFQFCHNAIAAGPVILVRYMRRAYEDDSPGRLRVTFDRDLRQAICREPEIRVAGPRYERVPLGGVVLEIKFAGGFPPWLARLVRSFSLGARSVSKYTICLRHAARATAAPVPRSA